MRILFQLVPCRDDIICTTPVFNSGNICKWDDGNPLFMMKCGTFEPECLYGVASFSKVDVNKANGDKICNGGSYFAKIHSWRDWIVLTMLFN